MRRIALPSVRRRNSASPQAHSSSSVGVASAVARVEVGQRAALRVLVPRADQLAVVAAVDAVADRGAQLDRDRPFVLDRQVGDAAPRVEPVRRDDRLRRADVDAGACSCRSAARPASVERQRQVDVDLAEEEHRAGLAATAPACACRASRGRCCAASSTSSTGAESVKTRWPNGPIASASRSASCCSRCAQHLVIVAAARVERDRGRAGGSARRCHSTACQPAGVSRGR